MALHARLAHGAVRVRAELGQGHAVRPQAQLPVQAEAPYHLAQQEVRGRLQRDQAAWRRRHHHASERTEDQTEIGLFWIESSPLAWNRLARAISASRGFDLWENARLFGLLNLAMADGYIASWEAKYHYSSGGRSPRFGWATPTATRLRKACRTGRRFSRRIPCRITTQGTQCKAAWRRRS